MNYYVIGFILVTTIGLIILAKKMKLGKDDWTKFKKKLKGKKKLSEPEKELIKNGLLLPCDERDYADLKGLKITMKDNPEILKKLNNLPEEFEKFGYEEQVDKE